MIEMQHPVATNVVIVNVVIVAKNCFVRWNPTSCAQKNEGHHPHTKMVNGCTNQQAAVARCAPFLNAPHRGQGYGRQATLPTQRRIAPIFRGADVPRLMGTSVAVQGTLLAEINGVGAGNPTAILQSNGVTANVQKASVQNQ